jgi:hypothetical protein
MILYLVRDKEKKKLTKNIQWAPLQFHFTLRTPYVDQDIKFGRGRVYFLSLIERAYG